MSRWEPDARGRLLGAAMELFTERGYDATTTAQIAERAGLTKTTLFRLFPDKREIIFQGQGTLVDLATDGVTDAPADADAVEVLRAALTSLSSAHTPERKQTGRTLDPIIASSAELQERAVFKRAAITSALDAALARRLGDRRQAGVLADLGVRAYYAGYDAWVASDTGESMTVHVLRELALHEVALQQVAPRLHHDAVSTPTD